MGREEREERRGSKVQELNYELLRQSREQLLREAERGRLVQELRATQRRVSSLPGGRSGGSIGRIAGRIFAALRVPREKARC